MMAIKGEMRSSFESMKVCAKVMMRFPGICHYRFANLDIDPKTVSYTHLTLPTIYSV